MRVDFDFLSIQIILSFILIMARLLALFMTAPVISRKEIPITIKIGLAAALSISIYSHVASHSENLISTNPWILTIAIFIEVFIGALIGFIANILFDALQTFGQVVGIQMGESSANIFDPASGASANPIAIFYLYTGLTIFLMLIGLTHLLELVIKTFEIAPLGALEINLAALAINAVPIMNAIFIVGLKLMMPILSVLILTDIFVALVAKILPQANMYFLIMPNKLILGMIFMSITFASFINNIDKFLEIKLEDDFIQLFN